MREVAGNDCLVIAHRRDRAEITTFPGRVIDNPYSLCLADVCPVGAWTGADFRFKQRVWFLTNSPSICPFCARGCNIWIDHRREEVFRIRPRVNEQVNKSWACDMGRLNYHSINDNRLTKARIGGHVAELKVALKKAAEAVTAAGSNLAVLVSSSLSVEEGKQAVALFKDKLGGKLYLHRRPAGEDDKLLKRADNNANAKGLSELGIGELPESGLAGLLVVLETVCPAPLAAGWPGPAVVISPVRSLTAEAAGVALPVTSFAESAGTVVNFEGVAQKYEAALKPKGEALAYVEMLERLAKAMGKGD